MERKEYLLSDNDKRFGLDLVEARKNDNDNAVFDAVHKTANKIMKEDSTIERLAWVQERKYRGKWEHRCGEYYFKNKENKQ